MSARYDTWIATARFSSLDGLRCLAVVPVVWHHATPAVLPGVLGRGPLGVDLFFVISGFLITTLLLREREARGAIDLASFYLRRSFRIFPLYYVVLGGFVAHALWLREAGPVRDHFLRSALSFATYTSNWFVDFDVPHPVVFSFAWSLATEEQFYVVWPCALVLGGVWASRGSRGKPVARSAGVAIGERGRGALLGPALFMTLLLAVDQAAERGAFDGVLGQAPTALRMLRSISTPIALGALLALGFRSRRVFELLAFALARPFAALVALAALVGVAVYAAPLFVAHLVMTALVGAAVLRPTRLFEVGAVAHVGRVSYGVYLLHVPIVVATRRLLGPAAESTLLVFVVALLLAVAAATFTRRWIEEPFLRLRDRVEARRLAAAGAGGGPPGAEAGFSRDRELPR